MPFDNSFLGRARSAARQPQNPSISALHRVLRISHSEASSLVAQLQDEGTLLAPMTGRQPGLHPDYCRHAVRRIVGNERLCHVRMVVQTALLCFELDEEATAGDSAVLKLHSPPGSHWKVLRTLFLEDWYGKQDLSLTEAALAYHVWLQERGAAPADCSGLDQAIQFVLSAFPTSDHAWIPRFQQDVWQEHMSALRVITNAPLSRAARATPESMNTMSAMPWCRKMLSRRAEPTLSMSCRAWCCVIRQRQRSRLARQFVMWKSGLRG